MSFLGMQVLLTGSGNFKDIQNSRQNCSKIRLDNCALSLVFTSINRRSERTQSKAVKKSRHRDVL